MRGIVAIVLGIVLMLMSAAFYIQTENVKEYQRQVKELREYNLETIAYYRKMIDSMSEYNNILSGIITAKEIRINDLLEQLNILRSEPKIPVNWITSSYDIFECESRWKESAANTAMVEGVKYEVIGIPQLLLDRPVRSLVKELGYTLDKVREEIGAQLHVAYVWAKRTDAGIPFRLWECR